MLSDWFINLVHFFNQSEVKQKPILTCMRMFSRTLGWPRITSSSFDWFPGLFLSLVIGQSNYDTQMKLALNVDSRLWFCITTLDTFSHWISSKTKTNLPDLLVHFFFCCTSQQLDVFVPNFDWVLLVFFVIAQSDFTTLKKLQTANQGDKLWGGGGGQQFRRIGHGRCMVRGEERTPSLPHYIMTS